MEFSQTKNERLQKFAKITFFLSLIGNIIFLILISLSHVYAIRNGYDWTYWELSELVLYGTTAKILFNTAIIINGTLLIPMLIILSYAFHGKMHRISYLVISSLVCLSLIGLGAFSEDQFLVVHYVFGTSFFVICSILVGYISIYILRNMKTIGLFYPIAGFLTFFVLIFHLATRWLFGMAYTQRIAIFLSLAFLLLLSGKLAFTRNQFYLSKFSRVL